MWQYNEKVFLYSNITKKLKNEKEKREGSIYDYKQKWI